MLRHISDLHYITSIYQWTISDLSSNGKSSIVEERLYSLFFALFQNKTKLRFFSFVLFLTINNEDVRFASILHNFKRFYFVLFRFLKFLVNTNSFYLRLWKCWDNFLRFTSFLPNSGTTWTFSLRSSEVQGQAIRFVFYLIKLRTKFIFASILKSCNLILFVSLRYLKGVWHEIFDFRFFFMNQLPRIGENRRNLQPSMSDTAADGIIGTAMKSCIHKHPTHLDQRPPKLNDAGLVWSSFSGRPEISPFFVLDSILWSLERLFVLLRSREVLD